MNLQLIKERLAIRGVKLNPPVAYDARPLLESHMSCNIDERFIELYHLFNGFNDGSFDVDNYIAIWSLEKIIARLDCNRFPYVAFADLSLDAELFEIDISNINNPVRKKFSGGNIAASFDSFWDYFFSPNATF